MFLELTVQESCLLRPRELGHCDCPALAGMVAELEAQIHLAVRKRMQGQADPCGGGGGHREGAGGVSEEADVIKTRLAVSLQGCKH